MSVLYPPPLLRSSPGSRVTDADKPFGRSVRPQSPSSACLPGRHIGRWPASLLALVLNYLEPADLARCSRVCRQWRLAATDLVLQAHCFTHSNPLWRQQVPEPQHVREALTRWCAQLSPGSERKEELERLLKEKAASRILLYSLTRLQVNSGRLSLSSGAAVPCGGPWLNHLAYSPDGSHLSGCVSGRSSHTVRLWREQGCQLQSVSRFSLPFFPHCLRFSKNGRQLRAVDKTGTIQVWRKCPVADRIIWSSMDSVPTSREIVEKTRLSPDSCYLAVATRTHLLIFHEDKKGSWQRQYSGAWQKGSALGTSRDRTRDAPLLFGARARHLLFVDSRGLRALQRVRNAWQEQWIEPDSPSADRPGCRMTTRINLTLDPHECLLAQAHCSFRFERRGRRPYPCMLTKLGLWRFEADYGWCHLANILRDLDFNRGLFPMAFHPDGQQLAFPERQRPARVLSILSIHSSDDCWISDRLQLDTHAGERRAHDKPKDRECALESLQFNVTGHCLAAISAWSGVQLWQRLTSNWVPVARIDNPGEPCCLTFSPDGYHCALNTMGNRISLWGPTPDGRYTEKAAWYEKHPVIQVLFSPDGCRLILSFNSARSFYDVPEIWMRCLHLMPADEALDAEAIGIDPPLPRPPASPWASELPVPTGI
ncbi:MAG: F-box/WD40 repeat-containing protein [Kistimonas sp.]|nr:F-box/WD40 repeat-containing protein [Kistimonas sp.]